MRLLSIGQFSQLVGLSVSALRFYADSGVMSPAHVDQDSGYRYYSPEQVATGQRVAALRQLELPLEELTRVLAAPPAEQVALLERHERRLYDRFELQRRRLNDLAALLSGQRRLPDVEVRLGHWPPQTLLSLTDEAEAEAFAAMYTAACAHLRRLAGRKGARLTGPDFGLYRAEAHLGGPLQVEVCLPVEWPDGRAADLESPARLISLPAQRMVAATHSGGWQTFNLTFAALYTAAHRDGLTPTGSSYTRSGAGGTELGLFLS